LWVGYRKADAVLGGQKKKGTRALGGWGDQGLKTKEVRGQKGPRVEIRRVGEGDRYAKPRRKRRCRKKNERIQYHSYQPNQLHHWGKNVTRANGRRRGGRRKPGEPSGVPRARLFLQTGKPTPPRRTTTRGVQDSVGGQTPHGKPSKSPTK